MHSTDVEDARSTTPAANYITHGSAPFVGTRPEQPLSMFNGKSLGSVNGIWKLRIQDSFAGDTGTLFCWSVNINQVPFPDQLNIGVFRPSIARWFPTGQPAIDWGAPGDMPVPGDYNGDGKADIAVFRPSNGTWYVNGGATVVWGMPGDIPVPGDYDGDHVTDMAVFRPAPVSGWCATSAPLRGASPAICPCPATTTATA